MTVGIIPAFERSVNHLPSISKGYIKLVSVFRKVFLRSKITALVAVFIALSSIAQAQNTTDLFSSQPEFLDVEQAFIFDFSQDDDQLSLSWQVADGYYLYKKQFQTVVKNATLSEATYPPSTQIEDEFFGISDVFFDDVTLTFDIQQAAQDAVVKIRYQGCASAGLCYPPTTKVVYLNAVSSNSVAHTDVQSSPPDTRAEQFVLADRLLSNDSLVITLSLFVLLGIGLAFTPCVFPMYPILSSIIVGAGGKNTSLSTGRAFFLSAIYVQGMAITYSLLGLVVASAGVQFQAALQSPLILSIFIVLFVALAVAMFGGYEIQLPSSWQEKLNGVSNKQQQGNPFGVFVMGIISGLVASPCTTAPLTAILLVIAQSGDLVLGFSALYALSIGMGIPLIIFGLTGGKLLPKAGQWMQVVKVTFGFMMLSVAILFVERFIVAQWTGLLWAALGVGLFSYWHTVNQATMLSFAKGVRSAVISIGLISSVIYGYNIATANTDHIFANDTTKVLDRKNIEKSKHPQFLVVKNIEDFYQKVAAANAQGKTVMLDLYADWCVACKEFEKYTFPHPDVVKALENTVWMQIDLTDNTPVNLEFQDHFKVLGLPTILFFDTNGYEIKQSRVTGFLSPDKFTRHIKGIMKSA